MMDVVVSELPRSGNGNKIKGRLKKLSEPFGGKVVSIQGQFAILRFPDKDSAFRATKLMNGEDVFGSRIRVLYSSQIEVCPSESNPEVSGSSGGHQSRHNQETCCKSSGSSSSSPTFQNQMRKNSKSNNKWKRSSSSSDQTERGTLDLTNLKKEVAALLQDVPNQTLPLFKFREMFERRYRNSISSFDLHRMRDVVNISESFSSAAGAGRNISLCSDWINKQNDLSLFCKLHPPKFDSLRNFRTGWAEKEVTPAMPDVLIDLKTLSGQVHDLLKAHNGALPLLSFLDCYEYSFGGMEIRQDGSGVPLEHLLSCVPGIEIKVDESGSSKQLQYADANNSNKESDFAAGVTHCQALQLVQLSRELVDILKSYPRSCVAFSKLIPAYHHHFGRQCRVADYGHATLSALLKTLPGTIQMMGDNPNRILTIAHKAQMKRFATDVLRLLKSQTGARKEIRVDDLPALLSQGGRSFSPQDYGLCYLSDLVEELTQNSTLVVRVRGEDGGDFVAIPKREQTADEVHRTRIFASEVFDLLRHSIRCEMPFSKFIPAYHHHFGRQCRVADYGFSKLAELFEAISDTVVAIGPLNSSVSSSLDGSLDDKILRLTPKEQIRVVGEQILNLIDKRNRGNLMTCLDELEDLFLQDYGFMLRPDLCEAADVWDLLANKLNHLVKVEGCIVALQEGAHLEQLVDDVKSILESQPDGKMELEAFLRAFKSRFHKEIHSQIIQKQLSHLLWLSWENQTNFVTLAPLRIFGQQLYDLVLAAGGCLPLEALERTYFQRFGKSVQLRHFGARSLAALLQSALEVVPVREVMNQAGRFLVVQNSGSANDVQLDGGMREDFQSEFITAPQALFTTWTCHPMAQVGFNYHNAQPLISSVNFCKPEEDFNWSTTDSGDLCAENWTAGCGSGLGTLRMINSLERLRIGHD